MTHDLATLAYLDLRLAINRLRLLARNPRRLIPWTLLAGWLLFTRVLRGLTYGAPGARHVAFAIDGSGLEPFVPALLLAVLAVPLWTASRRVPLTFASPADGLERGELALEVKACMDALAPHFQSVLVLREMEGLPCDQIAQIVGATHVTVRWRLHRGRKLFQEEWERRARLREQTGRASAESTNSDPGPDVRGAEEEGLR